MSSDPSLLTASEASAAIMGRRLSPVDLVEALLARIATQDAKLGAFVEVYGADARLAAEGADKAIRSGHAVGPLHGVPVALKDLIEIEGRTYTGGSAVHRGRLGKQTATIVRKMIGAGMIVLGKVHTVEFAYGGWGTNHHLGMPWNPWDPEVARTPGGSSSGSGVAVAARMAPWAIGTDTGGSVRLPAAFCGITGLKVTIGRVSVHGIQPLSPTLDTPGPMARSVRDAALLYGVIQGYDPLDANTRGAPAFVDPFDTLDRGVRGLRLGRMPVSEREGVDAAVLAAYDASLEALEGLGAEIVDVALPQKLMSYATKFGVTHGEAFALHGHLAEDEASEIDPAVRRRLMTGARLSARDYLTGLWRRDQLKAEMLAAWKGIDALLTPTTPMLAVAGEEVDQEMLPSRFTRFVNQLDLCALSLPNGFSPGGLPIGLQIAVRGWDEALALRIGEALQRASDWHTRLPPTLS